VKRKKKWKKRKKKERQRKRQRIIICSYRREVTNLRVRQIVDECLTIRDNYTSIFIDHT
jgi:hypothetical protein